MNWYLKEILIAGGVEEYLQSLGATPDIIQYIMSQGANSQILVNEFRQNPSLTIEQLQELAPVQEEQIDPYLPWEKTWATSFQPDMPQFTKWLLVNFKKIRNSVIPQHMSELPKIMDQAHSLLYDHLKDNIQNLRDWVSDINPELSNYTPMQAIQASEEWHRMMAGQGKGKIYEPTKPELIMYGPEWKNPKWQGWTVQKVMSKNDLQTEGSEEMMDHCVGSYCEDVEHGLSIIYSLRDPSNSPHVTMETDDYGNIKQIQGKSNSTPKPGYQEMIKEWVSTSGEDAGLVNEINAFEKLEEDWSYDSPGVNDITDTIGKLLWKDTDEYGLKYVLDASMTAVIDDLMTSAEAENSGFRNTLQEYRGDITNAPAYVANLALMEDLRLPNWPSHSGEWDVVRSMPKKTGWVNIQEVEQWAYETMDEIQEDSYEQETGLDYPQEENYGDPKEHEEAIREFEEAESEIHREWMRDTLKGGFAMDLIDEINDFRKREIVPSAQELFKRKQDAQEAKIKNSPAYQNAYDNMRDRVEQNQASNNWYKKAQDNNELV
jgi:hypothetical protein